LGTRFVASLAIAACLLLASAWVWAQSPVLVGRVTEVTDGDTIEVALASGPIIVRLHSIDTPERSQPWARQATAALERRLKKGTQVTLQPITQDKYDRLVAVVYNWWTLFVRLAQPQKHSEAITSRPLLLHGVARQTMHAGQTTITITSNHAKSHIIQSALQALTWFLAQLKNTAEQLTVASRMRLITRQAFRLFLDRISPTVPLLPATG